MPLWIEIPDSLPSNFAPPKNKNNKIKVYVRGMSRHGLQPCQEIISVSAVPGYNFRCVLLSQAMQSKKGMAMPRDVYLCKVQVFALSCLVGWLFTVIPVVLLDS
jgi:hypothetical protein